MVPGLCRVLVWWDAAANLVCNNFIALLTAVLVLRYRYVYSYLSKSTYGMSQRYVR